ncbi:MAG: hypothetical protein R3D98_13200 [Candidatus Krumholzibacteriia bacterium]
MDSLVALVQTRPETVEADIARALVLAGLLPVAEPPCLWLAAPRGGATPAGEVTPWQVAGVAAACRAAGASAQPPMVAWDPASPPRAAVLALLRHLGLERTADDHRADWLLGGVATDRRLRLVGAVAAVLERGAEAPRAAVLARRPDQLAAAVRAAGPRRPEGVVLDLTVCADGNDPVALNLVLAGRDLVAVDAVAARLLGLEPRECPLLAAAVQAGWGTATAAAVTLVGDPIGSLPLVRSRETRRGPAGWQLVDAPAWLRRLGRSWRCGPVAGRRPRRDYATTAWAKRWRDHADGRHEAKGTP